MFIKDRLLKSFRTFVFLIFSGYFMTQNIWLGKYKRQNILQMNRISFLILRVSLFLCFVFLSKIVFSFGGGSAGGYTGSQNDVFDCTQCHSGVINSGSALANISSNIPTTGYIAGQIYTIDATVTLNSINKFGFEITSEDALSNKVGSMITTNPAETQLTNNSTAITHTNSGNLGVNTKTWSFNWIAPAAGTGTINFYGSFIAANNNGNNSGDETVAVVLSIPESTINPCSLSLSNIVNVQCNSAATGSVQAQGFGGAISYHYTLYVFNNLINNWQTLGQSPLNGYTPNQVSFPVLTADSFRIILDDSLGCMDTAFFVITEPPPISVNATVNNSSTPFSNNGSIIVNVNGGSPQYTYLWNGPSGFVSSSLSVNNLIPGTYFLTITDANGCVKNETYIVGIDQPCSTGITNINPVLCNSDSTGSILITEVYGTPDFLYVLERQDISGNWIFNSSVISSDTFIVFTNLSAGIYRYTVNDSTGCSETSLDLQITEPNTISINSSINQETIAGACDGSISLVSNGGVGPFTYVWNNGMLGPIIDSLCSGWYCAQVTDANGCVSNWCDSVIVQAPCLSTLVVDIDSSLETCNGNDASITITVSGGTAPYFYSLDGGNSYSNIQFTDTILIDSISSGIYEISVIDSLNCFVSYGNVFLGTIPNPVIDSVTTINESCCGSDGQIFINTTFVAPLNGFSLDTMQSFQDSSIFYNLNTGAYLIYVQDENGCYDSLETYIFADSIPNINMTIEATNIVCNGDTNGTLKVYYPDSCYEYSLWRYTLFTPQIPIDTGTYFNNLISGYYGIIATSNSGYCVDSSSVHYIAEPDLIMFDTPITTASFCENENSCNGTIYLPNNPTGGIAPYSYYVNELYTNIPLGVIPTDSIFSNLCEGIYEVQVADANACVMRDTIVVQDSSLYIDSLIVSNIDCFGSDNGMITVYTHGGVGGYTYLWSDSSTTQSIDSLSPGSYIITVQDSASCFAMDSTIILQPDTLLFKIIEDGKKPESCYGVSYNGEIFLEITGGTPPYTHSWTSSAGLFGSGIGDTIFNLTADTIAIGVIDVNGCVASPSWGTINITIVEALNALNILNIDTLIANPIPICYGSSDGSIKVSLSSGEGPFQYSIDNGLNFSSDSIFTNLLGGTYFVIAKDTFGCLDSATVEILTYSEISIEPDSVKHVSCFNGNDGYISVFPNGGVGGYSYLWSPTLQTTSYISMLEANTYSVSVSDSAGCLKVDTILLEELTDPIQSIETIINDVSCFNGVNGSALIEVNGGMPFINSDYAYVWKNSNGDTVSFAKIADNLHAGDYLVFVTDSFNCGPFIDTVIISQPDSFFVQLIKTEHNLCFNDNEGSLLIEGQGGTSPYLTYFISDNNSNIFNQTITEFTSLSSGSYSLWIKDSNGCISDTLKDIKIGDPGKISLESILYEPSCHGHLDGQIEIILSGGKSPYNYTFMSNTDTLNQDIIHQNITSIEFNLGSEFYEIFVSDFNDCLYDTSISLSQPDEIISEFVVDRFFGEKTLSVNFTNQSTGSNSFIWDFGDGNILSSDFAQVQHDFISQGMYEVSLIASSSYLPSTCNDTTVVSIDVQGYDVFNVFTPNQDQINDYFSFEDWKLQSMSVSIFNRWGQKVYSWDQPNGFWNGRGYNGELQPEGVYFFDLEAVGENGAKIREKGSITLLR